ncbi:MAG: class D sortase [Armatimonadetes bacterium]|nr:class D sortase [Armatimonadota bacterium]
MNWQRKLVALILLIGITIAILPVLQQAYGRFSKWPLDREFEAQMRAAQGKTSQRHASQTPASPLSGIFSIRTAHAQTVSKPKNTVRATRASRIVSSTSRRKPVQHSRNTARPMGLVRIEIPRINMRAVVVDGTTNAQLARGPAHFKGTALPGEAGNCAIAGHRNMYGSWFKDLNRLRAGDQIILRTPKETHTYRVTKSKIVLSKDTSVLRPTKNATLTLVTCMIPYAKHRLIVFGEKV